MEQMQEFETEARNDLIEGRNAVIEALRAGRTIDKIFIAKGDARLACDIVGEVTLDDVTDLLFGRN